MTNFLKKCQGIDSGVIVAGSAERIFGKVSEVSPEHFLKESLTTGLNESWAIAGEIHGRTSRIIASDFFSNKC